MRVEGSIVLLNVNKSRVLTLWVRQREGRRGRERERGGGRERERGRENQVKLETVHTVRSDYRDKLCATCDRINT